MKKFIKGTLITVLILVLSGAVILTIGIMMGGFPKIITMAENGELSFGKYNGDFNIHVTDFDSNVDFDSNFEIFDGNYSSNNLGTKDQIKNLQVELGGGELIIEESSSDQIQVHSENAMKFQCYVDGDTLYVKGLKNIVTPGINHNTIYLELPSDMIFQEVNLTLGGGQILIDELNSSECTISLGAGYVEADTLFTDDLDISVGAGAVAIADGKAKNTVFDVGMGEIQFEGEILGDLDASCSMGSIDLDLAGQENDYNYNLDCSMGEIEINNSSYAGMASTRNIDHDAAYNITIECSMGSVDLDFSERR